jgi:tetratricopeptide (TPR) repeat protein
MLELSIEALLPYDPTVALIKALSLRAAIQYEQGAVDVAEREWRDLLPLFERLQRREVRPAAEVEFARTRANLAVCALRRGAFEGALRDANAAIESYRSLGMDGEAIRSSWTVGLIMLSQGHDEAGVRQLMKTAADFESLGMVGDAAFVKLEITGELLRTQRWDDAESIAREVADLFTRAGVTVASAAALDDLRRAVEQRSATVEAVQYLKEIVTFDSSSFQQREAPELPS